MQTKNFQKSFLYCARKILVEKGKNQKCDFLRKIKNFLYEFLIYGK